VSVASLPVTAVLAWLALRSRLAVRRIFGPLLPGGGLPDAGLAVALLVIAGRERIWRAVAGLAKERLTGRRPGPRPAARQRVAVLRVAWLRVAWL